MGRFYYIYFMDVVVVYCIYDGLLKG